MQSPSEMTSLVELVSLHVASLRKEKQQAADALRTQQLDFLKGGIWSVMKGTTQRKSWIYSQA